MKYFYPTSPEKDYYKSLPVIECKLGKFAIALNLEQKALSELTMVEIPVYYIESHFDRDNHELKDLFEVIEYEYMDLINEDYIYIYKIK